MVHPIVLGVGARLFTDAEQGTLELRHHEVFDSGIVILEYGPVAES